jgi:hypothetical protein
LGPITGLDPSVKRKISSTYLTISGRGISSDFQKSYLCISFLRKYLSIKQLSKIILKKYSCPEDLRFHERVTSVKKSLRKLEIILKCKRNSISQARLNVLVSLAIENNKKQMWTLKKLSVTFQTQITEEEFPTWLS